MKTPREILLQRHQEQSSNLDARREQVFNTLRIPRESRATYIAQPRQLSKPSVRSGLLPQLWNELFLPLRHVWIGCALAWIGVAAINLASGERPPLSPSHASAASREWAESIREQQRLVAELTGNRAPETPERTRALPPQPRSLGRAQFRFA